MYWTEFSGRAWVVSAWASQIRTSDQSARGRRSPAHSRVASLACASHSFAKVKQITVRYLIRPDGRVEERVEGVEGEVCRQLTERIEASIGPLERRVPTAAAFQPASASLCQTQPQEQSRLS